MFFECNLEKNVPLYYHPDIYEKLQETVNVVHERTAKLNYALDDCQLPGCKTRGETFGKIAKTIFDFSNERFDEMLPSELAAVVDALYDGKDAEPRMEWPNAVVLYDTRFVTTRDWESLRHFGIGGSDSSVLMGVNPYQTKEGLWLEKLGHPERAPSNDNKQVVFDRGHFLEDTVINKFCELKGATRIPEYRMFRHKDYPYTTANIDGILRMPDQRIAVFEAKSAVNSYAKKDEWKGTRVPPNYVSQCHQYLSVLNDPRVQTCFIGMIPVADVDIDGTYIGSAYADEFYYQEITKDLAYEQTILDAEQEFWDQYIINGIRPPRSGNASLDKKVADRYDETPLSDPQIEAQELSFDDWEAKLEACLELEELYKSKKDELDALENKRDAARLELTQDALGGAQLGTFLDTTGTVRVTVKNKLIRKEGVNGKKLKLEHPDVWKSYMKVSTYTLFSIKRES